MTHDLHALLQRPAGELAGLVRSGAVSALELTTAALERIEAIDPQINAFTDVDAERALAAAAAVAPGDERPLAGVPTAIKNNRAVEGLPVRVGARITEPLVAQYDHHTTMRLRRAGAILVGTTAMPEWGLLPTTEPRHREPTRNPWDLSRTPGGSSGGAAAAVAAGILPFAHGNDGGGSIRIPAACTGLVGLKAQRGRVSQGPETGDNYIVVDGALTRTVADSALTLDALAGPELGDATWAPPHSETYLEALERPVRRLRVGLRLDPQLAGVTVAPEYLAAVHEVAGWLADLGHEVVEAPAQLPLPGEAVADLMLDLFTDMGSTQQRVLGGAGKALGGGEGPVTQDDLDPLGWAVAERAAARNATDAWQTKFMVDGLSRMIIGAFSAYDVVLSPALVQAPLPIGTLHAGLEDPLSAFTVAQHFMSFSPVANLTGLPAIALPTHEHAGLPVGVEIMGRACEEHTLLQLALQLELQLGWQERRAPLAQDAAR